MKAGENTEKIKNSLQSIVDALFRARTKFNCFTDEVIIREHGTSKYVISTCEGLECIFIPCIYVDGFGLKQVFENYEGSRDKISEDLRFLLKKVQASKFREKFQGSPYFWVEGRRRKHLRKQKGKYAKEYYAHFESCSFMASVFYHALVLMEKEKLNFEGITETQIKDALTDILRIIANQSLRSGGWAWDDKSKNFHIYSTWHILETLDEIESEILNKLERKLEQPLDSSARKVVKYIERQYFEDMSDWYKRSTPLPDEEEDLEGFKEACRKMYEAIYVFIALIILNSKNRQFIEFITPIVRDMWGVIKEAGPYTEYRVGERKRLEDESIMPLYLRGLSYAFSKIGEYDPPSELLNEIEEFESIMEEAFNLIQDSTRIDDRSSDFYGFFSSGAKEGEIYYTERVVEALVSYYLYLEAKGIVMPPSTGSEKRSKNANDLQFPDLPLLNEIAGRLKNEKGNVFEDTIIIFVLHFLIDLVPLVEKFVHLGGSYKDMFFMVKPYDYPELNKLVEYMEERGCNVFMPKGVGHDSLLELPRDILSSCISKSKEEGGKRTLVVEDGGYFAPLFHEKDFKPEAFICVGAVEQTSQGYWRDFEIKDYSFPILPVSQSWVKKYVESPEVAATIQEIIVSVLKGEGKALEHAKVLVSGIGKIGTPLAKELNNKRMLVHVYDISEERRLEARQSTEFYRDKVLENLEDLGKFDIIIGTSGKTTLKKGEDFWSLKHNVILASGSSERVEFNLKALKEQSVAVSKENIFTIYTLRKGNKDVRVIYDGQPINFPLRGGISKAVIDPVYAEIFWAAVLLKTENFNPELLDFPKEIDKEVVRLYNKYHSSK